MSASIPATVPVYTTLVDGPTGSDINADDNNTPNADLSALATLVGMFGAGKTQGWGVDHASAFKNIAPMRFSKSSATAVAYTTGTVWVADSGQTIRLPRRMTAAGTLTIADLDTGSTVVVGYYYIYATADLAGTAPVLKISASASAPTGFTTYEQVGWIYNETAGSVLDITGGMVGTCRRPGVENVLNILDTTDTSATGDTNYHNGTPTIHFYAPSKLIQITAAIQLYQGSVNEQGLFCWSVDGSDQTVYAGLIKDVNGGGSGQPWVMPLNWYGAIAAAQTTLIPRLKANNGAYTTHMFNKVISIREV